MASLAADALRGAVIRFSIASTRLFFCGMIAHHVDQNVFMTGGHMIETSHVTLQD